MTLSPEEQLRNIAATALRLTQVKRSHNGRGRSATYVGNVDAIASTAQHLAKTIVQYLDGELEAIQITDIPF